VPILLPGNGMKLSVMRAWILRLWLRAIANSWPKGCGKIEFFFNFFGLHQGLGLIMKLSVTRAWILRLWLKATAGSWPKECGKFEFFFIFFLDCIKADYEALSNESLIFETLAWRWAGRWPKECEKFEFFFDCIKAWVWLWSCRAHIHRAKITSC
jgi:hypothetical protein